MSTRGALAVIAGIVLALGVVLAFVPTSISDDIGCGSALAPDSGGTSEAGLADFSDEIGNAYAGQGVTSVDSHVSACEDRVTTQRLVAFPVAGVGVLALAFLGLTSARVREASEPGSRSDR